MRRMGWLIPIVALAAGCQKSPEGVEGGYGAEPNPPQPSPDYGQEPYGQPEAGTNGGEYTAPQTGASLGQSDVPALIRDLKQNAENIRTLAKFESTELVASLRNLTAAFQALPYAGTEVNDAAARINSFADRIEASGTQTEMHGRWSKRALTEAVGALQAYQTAQNLADMEDRLATIRGLVDAIRDDQAVIDQKEQFANVYDAFADTLAFASTPRSPMEPGTR